MKKIFLEAKNIIKENKMCKKCKKIKKALKSCEELLNKKLNESGVRYTNCPYCKGHGEVEVVSLDGTGTAVCSKCDGFGLVEVVTNFFELKDEDAWSSSESYESGDVLSLDGEKQKIGAINESMTESDVAFSSRFMPNVKFKTNGFEEEISEALFPKIEYPNLIFEIPSYFYTLGCGEKIVVGEFVYSFEDIPFAEVSPFEAIPELVPEGMVYDKESDSLVEEVKESFEEGKNCITIDLTKPTKPFVVPEHTMKSGSCKKGKAILYGKRLFERTLDKKSVCEDCVHLDVCFYRKSFSKDVCITECVDFKKS